MNLKAMKAMNPNAKKLSKFCEEMGVEPPFAGEDHEAALSKILLAIEKLKSDRIMLQLKLRGSQEACEELKFQLEPLLSENGYGKI